MADWLNALLWIAGATLVGVVVDTYFWVRTQLRLREFNEELQPRLQLLDRIPEVFPQLQTLVAPLTLPQGTVVLRAKNKNRTPYIVVDGKARFLSEAQAAAVAAGEGVLPGPRPPTPPAPTAPFPSSDPAGNGPGPDLDYAGMARSLGVPEGDVRAFIAAHQGGGTPAPPAAGTPPGPGAAPAPSDPMENILMGLVNGAPKQELEMEAARLLFERQNGRTPPSQHVNPGGLMWG